MFFFGSYEQYRGRFGLNFIEAAPSLSLAAPGAFIPGTTNLVNSVIQPFIAAFRSPDVVVLGTVLTTGGAANGFDLLQLQDSEKTNERALAARFDYKHNEYNNFYFRFFRDQGTDVAPEGAHRWRRTVDARSRAVVADFEFVNQRAGISENRLIGSDRVLRHGFNTS